MLGNIIDFFLEPGYFILIALHIGGQQKCKVLHDLRLAFGLAGPLGRYYIVICLDLLIDLVDHSTDFQQERIGVLKRNGL